MNASYEWLRDFVPFDLSPYELRDLITSRVATVDDVVRLRQDLQGIVVGRVVEAARHPDSDHLWVTKVDAGGGQLRDVVCGAPNVEAGALYPFAPVGALLPGGLKIEKRRIRGALSEGMLCSARELKLGADHEGILKLTANVQPGSSFLDAMTAGDSLLVIDVLPNRPDLLSHRGIAREIAAATGIPARLPKLPLVALDGNQPSRASTEPAIRADVEDKAGCPRYMGAHITGVRVGPSPDWLAARIEAVGGRSINNVVDATNYMLHGFGQPMHAFDVAKIGGARIVVRDARAGERLTTLDGVDRVLEPGMTVIADVSRAQAIAGVIGGRDSEVNETTTDIFLEVAVFDPARVRATRRRLGISTDASYRFERGIDSGSMADLLDYAVKLITALAGGSIVGETVDVGGAAAAPGPLTLRPSRVAQVLGIDIGIDAMQAYLGAIGFSVEQAAGSLKVTPPAYRLDIEGEIELIEELARLHGFSEFPSEIRRFRPGTVPDAPLETISQNLRNAAVAAGLYEARPMPFVREGAPALRVLNPLAEDEAFLRTSILDTLARRAEYNLAQMERSVRLFEIGTVFGPATDPSVEPPREHMRVAAIILGPRRPAHFTEPRPPEFDEWDAKALAVALGSVAFQGRQVACVPGTAQVLWNITADGVAVGTVERLSLDSPVWAAPAWGIEIDIQGTYTAGSEGPATAAADSAPGALKVYTPIPTRPAMQVDLALIVPDGLTAGDVEAVVRHEAGELLESLVLFDEYRGPGVPERSRSLAWALTFRHPERTLRDKEIHGRTAKILTSLEKALGIKQRTS